MAKSFAWSYSVLESFETCPWRHYRTKVLKDVVEPQSKEMADGNRVHKALELRVAEGRPLPEDLSTHEPLVQKLVASAEGGVIEAEQKMALNARFEPVRFFAHDCWVRGITDVTVTKGANAFIGDYKTGNPKPNSAQLRLTAAMTFHHKPYVQKVSNAFIWLKTGEITRETFTRDQVPAIWQEFAPRVQRLEIAVQKNADSSQDPKAVWPKRPSGLCRKWCPLSRAQCEFSGG